MAHKSAAISLPVQVTSRYDIGRLIRELEALEDFFTQNGLRKKAGAFDQSTQLQALAAENKLNISHKDDRETLKQALVAAKKSAPVVHVSFAVAPETVVVEKILMWFRREVGGDVLLHVGVQPSIAAGCVVRTPNNYFDFSLRQHLMRNSHLLLEKLKELK